MTGQRLEIAKATVEKILQTLSDDDYFNVIKVDVSAVENILIICTSIIR